MFEIPEMCMKYTDVFRAVRIEHGITLIVGVLIGCCAAYLHRK